MMPFRNKGVILQCFIAYPCNIPYINIKFGDNSELRVCPVGSGSEKGMILNLRDMGPFENRLYTHVNIGCHLSDPPGLYDFRELSFFTKGGCQNF